MKAFVDKDGCIGCGVCVEICPQVFEMDSDNKSQVICDPVPDDAVSSAKEAAESCPVSVITVE